MGEIGPTGYTGVTGERGHTGYTGIMGMTGPTGYTGVTGQRGHTGYTGVMGEIGPTGVIGYTGYTGYMGATGYTGVTGDTGPTGLMGEMGPTGYTGVTGQRGHTGYTGVTGQMGPTGYTGVTGQIGPIGYTGVTGQIGPTGYTGMMGDSSWTTSNGNIYYNPGANVSVGIGTSTPNYTLDVSGTLGAAQTSYFNNISERVKQTSNVSQNVYDIDYNDGASFYLSNYDANSNITLKINNFPSINDANRSYIVSSIMKGSSSTYSYVNNVLLSDNSTNHVSFTPKFASDTSDIETQVSAMTSNDFIMQQFVYLYLDGSGNVLSNISTFN